MAPAPGGGGGLALPDFTDGGGGLAPFSLFADTTEAFFCFALLSGGGGGRTGPAKGGGLGPTGMSKAGGGARDSSALARFDLSRLRGAGGGFRDFANWWALGGGGLGLSTGFCIWLNGGGGAGEPAFAESTLGGGGGGALDGGFLFFRVLPRPPSFFMILFFPFFPEDLASVFKCFCLCFSCKASAFSSSANASFSSSVILPKRAFFSRSSDAFSSFRFRFISAKYSLFRFSADPMPGGGGGGAALDRRAPGGGGGLAFPPCLFGGGGGRGSLDIGKKQN